MVTTFEKVENFKIHFSSIKEKEIVFDFLENLYTRFDLLNERDRVVMNNLLWDFFQKLDGECDYDVEDIMDYVIPLINSY